MPPSMLSLRPLFAAIVRLLDRFDYPSKFGAVAIVFGFAVSLYLQQVFNDYGRTVAAVKREIAALEVVDDGLALMVDAQLHRERIDHDARKGAVLFILLAGLRGIVLFGAGNLPGFDCRPRFRDCFRINGQGRKYRNRNSDG